MASCAVGKPGLPPAKRSMKLWMKEGRKVDSKYFRSLGITVSLGSLL